MLPVFLALNQSSFWFLVSGICFFSRARKSDKYCVAILERVITAARTREIKSVNNGLKEVWKAKRAKENNL